MEIRPLSKDEIEVRVGECRESYVTLLLYKNARCDMAILDDMFGSMNWQREHYECKGTLFCRVGVLDREVEQWVWKSDAGSESQFEAEKGEASDSFKRACTNWGIGRELYTAPRICVGKKNADIRPGKRNGTFACYDRFSVEKIVIENHRIRAISIRNDSLNTRAFVWMEDGYEPNRTVETVQGQFPGAKVMEER